MCFSISSSPSPPPLKQQPDHSSRNLGLSSSYLALKPVLRRLGRCVPYSLADWSLHTLCYRKDQLEFSCSVHTHTYTHTHTHTLTHTFRQGDEPPAPQQRLPPLDIVSVEKKAVCIYGYISAHLYIFDM
uniref:Uncharacterized protein n=1 Tax=Pipistrellus kuhlii TaxID=59472 RepID=A0A7J7ZJF1_PIPKU|nr:hypothetical protein mPipKuh1_009444 [Pipistrellus kuhlii]